MNRGTIDSKHSSDSKGQRITDPLPNYIKEHSITFSKTNESDPDIISNFMAKYWQEGQSADIKKSLQKNFIFAKHKVKPDFNTEPRTRKSHLSLSDKRKLGLYKLPRKGLQYREFLKLNELWRQYMLDSLDFPHFSEKKGEIDVLDKNWEQLKTQLYKADYHGAQISVVRAKCPSQVGLQGIIVMDTKNTFKVIGPDDVLRTIPKESCIFQFHLDQFKLTVYGKHLCIRPAERSTKKIRNNLMQDL